MSVEYMEQLIKEEGATIWKSDKNGYVREEKVNRTSQWDDPIATELLNAGEDNE